MFMCPSIRTSRLTARVIARTAIHPRHSLIVLPSARRLQSTAAASTTGTVTPPPPSPASPPPPPPRTGGLLRTLVRWTIRLIYISALGSIGYFAYSTHPSLALFMLIT